MIRRGKLSKLYTTFIRPVFEYSSVAWDGYTKKEKFSYQQQLQGLYSLSPVFSHIESLYLEKFREPTTIRSKNDYT